MQSARKGRTTPAGSTETVEARRRRWQALVCVVIVGVAAVGRIYASLDDFWLDEIWSWQIARECGSWRQILEDARVDNNHFLNTWVLFVLGPDRHWFIYRIPAVLAGVGAVVLAGILAAPRGFIASATALALTGGSYLLIHYSTEARGYAYVQFFALASLLLMRQSLNSRRWWCDLLFGVSAALGFLSHLTYLYGYLAVVVWSVWQELRSNTAWRTMIVTAARCHALPLGLMAWLYAVNLGQMIVGGGTRADAGDVAFQTASLALGGHESGRWMPVVATAALLLLLIGLTVLWRAGSTLWLLYFVAIIAGPVLLLMAALPEVVYPRYFLVAVLFLLLMGSDCLSRLYHRGRAGRAAYWLLLLTFLAANGLHTARLIRVGRGGYLETVRFIHEHTRAAEVTIGSDHEFRNFMVFGFYERYLADPKPTRYFSTGNWPETGPEWMLCHSQERDSRPLPAFTDFRGNRYTLVHRRRFAGQSGWDWAVYRNAGQVP